MSSVSHHSFEFLLLNGFSNLVLASALEPLRDVKMRTILASLDWKISTLDGEPVDSSSLLNITPDQKFDPCQPRQTLVIVAGYQIQRQVSRALSTALRQKAKTGDRIIALDTASWLLAEAGLLDGHRATIHWQELEVFSEQFPNVGVSNRRFERSGQYITCGGASATLDMMLDLIHELFGPMAAFDASSMFVFDPAQQTDLRQSQKRLRNRGAPKLLQALNVIAKNLETPLTTFELAKEVSLSERSLSRLFSRELGMTPGKYFKLSRLQRAKYLAEETSLTMEQIALRCGFSCGSSLSRSFTATFGLSFSSIR